MSSSYHFIDTIKTEKANALARYQTLKNITKLFQAMEVFAAVALISWSSTHLPHVLKSSTEYVLSLPWYLLNQHVVVFILGNMIVAVCYFLSRYSHDPDNIPYDDNCLDSSYVKTTTSHVTDQTPFTAKTTASHVTDQTPFTAKTTASHVNETQFTPLEVTERQFIAKTTPLEVITESSQNIMNFNEELTVKTTSGVKGEMKKNERFQRSKSDKIKREEVKVKSGRELRRSVTTVRSGGDAKVRAFGAVEKLSDEEFNVAVEMFILRQQRFLKEERMVEE